jgi:CubicO group peptidase (beta-lactamase class C family)
MQETNGASIAVIQNGEVQCEMYGSRDGRTNPQSLQVIFSTSKVVNSIATAMLVDRKKLDYNLPISKYWPEFGKNGKEHISVKNLMQHSAGLSWTCDRDDSTDDTLHVFSENVSDYMDSIKSTFERSHLNFPKGETPF